MKYWIVFILMIAASAYGGDGAGNGDAVNCSKAGVQTAPLRLLDFFERDPSGGFKASLGAPGLTVTQKALFAIERIKALDPTRYARYHEMAASFLARSRMVNGPLYDYNDTGPTKLPAICSLKPVSIQRPAIDPSDKPFTVDTKVWGALPDDDERAGVILHEVVYNETLSLGQQTSESARKYTGLLASAEFDNIDVSDYRALIDDIFLPHLPEFVSNVINLNAQVGQSFSIDLFTLLSTVPNRTLSWGTTSDKPAWLNLDLERHQMAGLPGPADIGRTQFDLVARDEEGEALALIQLTVGAAQVPSIAAVFSALNPSE
jgi:hypothetical protein